MGGKHSRAAEERTLAEDITVSNQMLHCDRLS